MKRKIKLTKYAFNEDSEFLLLDSEFELAENHPSGIEVGYTKTGRSSHDPEVGKSFCMSDNGRLFMSSPVVEILKNGFKTLNSYYRIEVLETYDEENIQDNNIIL